MFLLKLLSKLIERIIAVIEKLIAALPFNRLSQTALERVLWMIVIGFLFMLFSLIQGFTWIWLIQFLLTLKT